MYRVWNKIDSDNMVYGGTWGDVETSIQAKVFGHMLELAQGRLVSYRSDLYHDALWIDKIVTGPCQFDWVARESGTFIGDSVQHIKLDDWVDAVKYRFEIINEDGRWMLNIYQDVPLVSVSTIPLDPYMGETDNVPDTVSWVDRHAALDISECDVAKAIEGCIFHPAPVGGWTVEEDPLDVSCIGYKTFGGIQHGLGDQAKDNCPVHGNNFPTLRNESTQTGKVTINMDSILRELREKLDEANSARDEAYDAKNELDDAISEFDDYIDQVENLIGSLDDMPSLSVDLDLRVSFEA